MIHSHGRWSLYSLAGQTFAARGGGGKERLVTIDRFPWHGSGGIQYTWRHLNITRISVVL